MDGSFHATRQNVISRLSCGLRVITRTDLHHPADPRFLSAWAEGVAASVEDRPRATNPYLPDTMSGWGWACGWDAATDLIEAERSRRVDAWAQ